MKVKIYGDALAAQKRITGKEFCYAGHHYVPVERIAARKPRVICTRCADQRAARKAMKR